MYNEQHFLDLAKVPNEIWSKFDFSVCEDGYMFHIWDPFHLTAILASLKEVIVDIDGCKICFDSTFLSVERKGDYFYLSII